MKKLLVGLTLLSSMTAFANPGDYNNNDDIRVCSVVANRGGSFGENTLFYTVKLTSFLSASRDGIDDTSTTILLGDYTNREDANAREKELKQNGVCK